MKPWNAIVRSLRNELDRLSQEVEGRRVLPNTLEVGLPEKDFERFSPVLQEITNELGETIANWAEQRRCRWYNDLGPFLKVELRPCRKPEIRCEHSPTPPEFASADDQGEPQPSTERATASPKSAKNGNATVSYS